MNADLGADWLGRVWLLTLAFTGAVLCVALVRRACRRLFGAECAFAAWALPPLAMLASQLPHVAVSGGALSDILLVVLPAGGASPLSPAPALDWRAALAWIWLAGIAVCLARASHAQARYRAGLRQAVPLPGVALAWPVLRARSPQVGPALVGAWRSCIVLPSDFEQRYDVHERALVLAHEAMHARRRDGWWSLLAHACASLCWFHPLAWWALAAVRHDQELACDAAVLRECRGGRHRYARAMLKTPLAAQGLPVGCSWSSRHPLTERIAMLKAVPTSSRRRRAGLLAILALAAAVAGIAYAAGAGVAPGSPAQAGSTAAEYQLDMQLALLGDDAEASHAQRVKVALCTRSGVPAGLSTHGIRLDATPHVLAGHRVRVDLAVRTASDARPVAVELSGALDRPLHASGPLAGRHASYGLQVVPRLGCPARALAGTGPHAPVTLRLKGGTVRGAAELVANQAGLSLANPQVLGDGPVALEFRDVPADRAMQWIARLGGAKAVFGGREVRFQAP